MALEAAVLELQIDVVWGWADAVADGSLGREELERLADEGARVEVVVERKAQKNEAKS